ncbi:ABC transporter permease subunit [Acholeplasma equirhinis]|uniref:ABC transporter permease subunit n=1 Tax=Acholeplasma equirhinis TaxID=555393 RepID=UPI00197AD24C|nr:ABC transporter permease subunit [Acholeplasma equirhinis]MBN3490015.1 ABC transporter permease subunit [Acholeplasma equirhinis]
MFNLLLSPVDTQRVIDATIDTIVLLLVSGIISLVLGTITGFILALYGKNRPHEKKWVAYTLSVLVSVIRSIPFILLMVIIVPISFRMFGTSIGFIPSIISLSIIGFATVSRQVEQAIADINPQIYDLSKSLGANQFQLFRHFIYVEAKAGLILGYTTSLISLLAYSTVVFIVGGGGLGYTAIQLGYYTPNGQEIMWVSTIIMIIMVQIIQILGSMLARYLDKKKRN